MVSPFLPQQVMTFLVVVLKHDLFSPQTHPSNATALAFEMRAAQRRVVSKIEAKFCLF